MARSDEAPIARGRWVCPIAGLQIGDVDAPVELMSIRDQRDKQDTTFWLTPMAADFKERLAAGASGLPAADMDLALLSAAVETDALVVYGDDPPRSTGLRVIGFALSLWLPRVGIPWCFVVEGSPNPPGGLEWTDHEPLTPALAKAAQPLPVSMRSLRATIHAVVSNYAAIEWPSIRFYLAGQRPHYLDTVFEYALVLEALLCRGGGGELRYRVSTRAAILLGETPERRAEIRKEVTRLYDLRSAIVHGRPKEAGKLVDRLGGLGGAVQLARRLSRGTFLAVLQRPQLLAAAGLDTMSLQGEPPGPDPAFSELHDEEIGREGQG